jgi:transposase InsO family protein
VKEELAGDAKLRRTRLLEALDIATSSWYRQPVGVEEKKRPGPAPQPIAEPIRQAVIAMAMTNPWYGYKRIAVMCRRVGQAVQDRHAYVVMREAGLLQKPRPRAPELYQAAKLFELLPQKPNDLWQMDVTYIHIPGHGWWYAVTVIDYYSRYLLACRLTSSYSAIEVSQALAEARQEAERLHGPLAKPPFLVTDNGPSFLAKRFAGFIKGCYQHVRIAYRTPQQLGLLERFHQTLKTEEVYWRLYADPAHARACLAEFRERYNRLRPHWALRPEGGGDPLVPEQVYADDQVVQLPRWQQWAKAAKEKLDKMMGAA